MSGPQLPLPFALTPSRAREDFVVAPGNEAAVRFIDAWPNWPAAAALYGPSGSGKTHLVHAWAEKSGAQILDASLLDEPRAHALDLAKPLAIENVDSAPAAVRDGALFALLNSSTANLLLTGREHPRDWPVLLPDLASRLRALLAFALWEPDDALLEAVARKLFADRQLKVPDTVIARMVVSLERSPAAVRDFVAKADAKALAEKRPVTVALIRDLLSLGA